MVGERRRRREKSGIVKNEDFFYVEVFCFIPLLSLETYLFTFGNFIAVYTHTHSRHLSKICECSRVWLGLITKLPYRIT